MISLQELTAWRAVAPWSDDLMVEQDYLLSRAVQLIFTDTKLKTQLAMRGGTVLHKGHLAPASRYSEDIDLVLTANRSHEGIKQDIVAVLAPLLGKPSESVITTVTLAVRNLWAKSKVARITYVYSPTSQAGALASLKVEVNLNERKPLFPLTTINIEAPSPAGPVAVPVVSYALDEMLGTKLRALVQREHGRDLFDLSHAIAMSQGGAVTLDPARVGQAFRFYLAQEDSVFSAADVQAELLRRMKSRRFLRDMEGYLPEGRTYDPHLAHDEFCKVILPHIDR